MLNYARNLRTILYYVNRIRKILSDLSCLFLLEIPLDSIFESEFKNGIVITHNHNGESRCFSYLGQCSGCGWPSQYGAPSNWQVINLSSGCGSFQDERAAKHEILHALGVQHEHQRTGMPVLKLFENQRVRILKTVRLSLGKDQIEMITSMLTFLSHLLLQQFNIYQCLQIFG